MAERCGKIITKNRLKRITGETRGQKDNSRHVLPRHIDHRIRGR